MTLIVGLDTSSTGWHSVQSDNEAVCNVQSNPNPDIRRIQLYRAAREYFELLPEGTVIFCEEPLALAKNGKTTRLLGLAAGAIWAAYTEFDLEWHWVDVASWKKAIVGNGNASKTMIKAWAEERLNAFADHGATFLDDIRADSNFYDAYCIMLYGRKMASEIDSFA